MWSDVDILYYYFIFLSVMQPLAACVRTNQKDLAAKIVFILETIMKNQPLIILTMTVFTFGCAHTYKVDQSPSAILLEEMHQKWKDQEGKVFLTDGQRFDGKNFQIRDDSTFWVAPGSGEHYSISTSNVGKITFLKRGRGALEGFGLFTLIMGGAGALLIGSAVSGLCEYNCDNAFEKGALAGAAVFGVGTGVVLGLPIGAAIGSREKYIFIAPTDSSSNTTGTKFQK